MKDDRFYLIHVAECISKVEEYVASGHDSFMDTSMIQDAVLTNLQIRGESTGRISVETRAKYPDIDWRGIVGLRNVIVHDYLGVTLTRVWELIELNLPALKNQVEAMLRDLEAPPWPIRP